MQGYGHDMCVKRVLVFWSLFYKCNKRRLLSQVCARARANRVLIIKLFKRIGQFFGKLSLSTCKRTLLRDAALKYSAEACFVFAKTSVGPFSMWKCKWAKINDRSDVTNQRSMLERERERKREREDDQCMLLTIGSRGTKANNNANNYLSETINHWPFH